MKSRLHVGSKTLLPLCDFCATLGINPPSTHASTNFVEKKAQDKSTKKSTKRSITMAVKNRKRKAQEYDSNEEEDS